MMTERGEKEPVIDSDQAYKFLMLLRGGAYNVGGRKESPTQAELDSATDLIERIGGATVGINKDALLKMMTVSPIGMKIPGRESAYGWFDFGVVANNWQKPEEDVFDQFEPFRQTMREEYGVGDLEAKFLAEGFRQISRRHPSKYIHSHGV